MAFFFLSLTRADLRNREQNVGKRFYTEISGFSSLRVQQQHAQTRAETKTTKKRKRFGNFGEY